MNKIIYSFIIIVGTSTLAGCQHVTREDVGLAGGGVAGGLLGNAITGGSTIGTIGGAVGGAFVGREIAKNSH